jgi:rhamnosyltransferase subunit B
MYLDTMTPAPKSPKIVLATYGTLGDLHPFLALAIALRERGADPVIAAAEIYRQKVTSEGIRFHHMRPDLETIAARLKMDYVQLARAVAERPEFIVRDILLPHVRESFDDVMTIAHDASLIVTHSAAYGAKLAAEKCRVPQLGVVLQPMLFLSSFDPPIIANAPRLSQWIYAQGQRWTRVYFNLGKALARRWARPIDQLRKEVGLPHVTAHPLFEGQFSDLGALALYSPLFGGAQPDHPSNTSIVGFAFYESQQREEAHLDATVMRFLDASDETPIVFTLGTSAVHDAERFMRESLKAIHSLKVRAIFVLDAERAQRWSNANADSVLIASYAPYAKLFPRGRLIVHHGGIGTTAQALRAGKPQLIAPYLVDQPDNAHRVERMGCGRTLALSRYTAKSVCEVIRDIERGTSYASRAAEIGRVIAREDGARAGAQFIMEKLRACA